MSKSKLFISLCVSFAAGILLTSLFPVPPEVLYVTFGVFTVTFALAYFWGGLAHPVSLAALLMCCFLFGAWRMQFSQVPSLFKDSFSQKQSFEGYIVEDPDIRLNAQLLTIRPAGFDQNVLVTTRIAQKYAYGEWVVVEGKIEEPKNFNDFDYKNYLERFNVYGVVSYPRILVLREHKGNRVKEVLLNVKHAFVGRVSKLFKEPYGSLLTGVLIGAKKTLPQTVVDNFTTTGLSHIVAVSGYNISIIVVNLGFLAYYLGRKGSFIVSCLLIVAFIVISGASASVVRAGIMGFLLLVSFRIGRLYAVVPSLCAAAATMLFINPKILYYDIGFQLSFAATLGIVLLAPPLEELTQNWHDSFNVLNFRSNLITTFSAILFTLPLILFHFGRLSVVAPLANVLILPVVPAVMLFGFLIIIPFVGIGIAFVAQLIMMYMLTVITWLAAIPHAAVPLKISGIMVMGLAALVLGFYVFVNRIAKRRFAAAPLINGPNHDKIMGTQTN